MTHQYFFTLHLCLIVSSLLSIFHAFTPTVHRQRDYVNINNRYNHKNKLDTFINHEKSLLPLHLATSPSSSLPNVSEMKASDLRKELQSYGISTKSFFEKSELVEAVEKARAEGKTPIKDGSGSGGEKTQDSGDSSSASRDERLAKEIETCNKMKVGELKKELESYGISTKSFFEKSEFVKATAEARVDGVKKSERRSTQGSSRSSRDEVFDPSYRDVIMQKMDRRTLMGSSPVIDIRIS